MRLINFQLDFFHFSKTNILQLGVCITFERKILRGYMPYQFKEGFFKPICFFLSKFSVTSVKLHQSN